MATVHPGVSGTHTNTGKTTTTLREPVAAAAAAAAAAGSRRLSHESAQPAAAQHAARELDASAPGGGGIDFDLDALQQRHQADKQKAALIRQTVQGSVAS